MPTIIPSPSWSNAELSAADIASLPYSKWIQEDLARPLVALVKSDLRKYLSDTANECL